MSHVIIVIATFYFTYCNLFVLGGSVIYALSEGENNKVITLFGIFPR